jgi:hypothetical protein
MEFQIPYKLLFTHFMERSASVANIKCGEVAAYLPIYKANDLEILSKFLGRIIYRSFEIPGKNRPVNALFTGCRCGALHHV